MSACMSHEKTMELIAVAQTQAGTTAAENAEAAILVGHKGLIWREIRKYANGLRERGLEEDDLVQEGRIALLAAIRNFDLARGVKFSTYAYWKLRRQFQELCRPDAILCQEPEPDADSRTGGERRQMDSFIHGLPAPEEPGSDRLQGVRDEVRRLLGGIHHQWRHVMELRYGLDGHGQKTMGEVAKLLGASQARVDQILRLAIAKLRELNPLLAMPQAA